MDTILSAPAKIVKPHVIVRAQFQAGSKQQAIDIQTGMPFEFNYQSYLSGGIIAAAQYPAANTEN
jgi:hypothetical protein